ncbi:MULTISPECIES: zinc-binding dehydrogenase [Amycolatopsis]|uniref:Zinc-binding dehydrogenase n=2 Tax=Amycolatopsis TaxID=1813 RepID=A0A1I3WGW1_9PSEU|nr:zinc-binding dehydrogenase [Amycolatopsis sacchari]SFK06630.1 Zinc-binding dehydrogenase [Amycolatopsis sacchari]
MDLTEFLNRGATLRTITVGSRGDFERMNRVISRHELRPVIDRVFPFDEAPAAFAYFPERTHFGKVVITHRPPAPGYP